MMKRKMEILVLFGNRDELEAISSLFQGRIPQKPGKLHRERPLPLPSPHRLRPLGLPKPKSQVKLTSSSCGFFRASMAKKVYKSPSFLVGLAREISRLGPAEDVSKILGKWVQFLRKGSLSLTIRELGHMGFPERALQTFLWAQNQPHLFLMIGFWPQLLSRAVLEAMIKGFIKGGNLRLAWEVLVVARRDKRMLDSSIYAKLILELGKNPDRHRRVFPLLEELGERDELNLSQQDCTAIMKLFVAPNDLSRAMRYFSRLKEAGFSPTFGIYKDMLQIYMASGRTAKCKEICKEANIAVGIPSLMLHLFADECCSYGWILGVLMCDDYVDLVQLKCVDL
ncbi:unnamed protein product [Sphenostylis stenocarpa]|uniref:Pentatricopeptide repeat-containing protein n=1 Tax=Sphenostylis stenocarpa TaxID=92480 RepID=A0AA86V7L6_9FABA|nr:unnamed protein product [Sphenostylis stenocarpa]